MKTIEIDDEIYSYLKSKAEPFVNPPDTPNAVLRRLLLREPKTVREIAPNNTSNSDIQDSFPGGVPVALKHILQVVHLVTTQNCSRSRATHKLANYYKVAPQTIIDKYTRQLGITASEFDRHISSSDRSHLARLLNNKFAGYENLIDQYVHMK